MASLGNIHHIISSCLSIWYRTISAGRKGSANAGELAVFSGPMSCTSFITGDKKNHGDEVPARENFPKYYCRISLLELNEYI